MKKLLFLILNLFIFLIGYSQSIKVAILDFENTSGKTEYDALGKAMSSMLITDLKNNIHPKKVDFFERAQLNKLLDEQKLQKSKNFDAKTAVDFGKLSGVNYVFVGSVFVLDGNCNISSKLVDVKTSKIILSKEANGKIETWLQLKSELAESIANQLNNPVTLDPAYKSQSTTLATLNQYCKIITTMDNGDLEKAEQMRGLFEETNPDFKYFKDIKEDIEKLKQRVAELENVTDVLTDAFELGQKALSKSDYKSAVKYFEKFILNPGNQEFIENRKLYAYGKLSIAYFKNGDFENALLNATKANKIYCYYPETNEIELMSLMKLKKNDEAKKKYNFILDSISYANELSFRRENKNELLEWKSMDGLFYGLMGKINQDEDDFWCYEGMPKSGYYNKPKNEFKIRSTLKENNIDINILERGLNQYQKKEKKLLELNDSEVFSSPQILYLFKSSLEYADELRNQKDFNNYKNHLEKEIQRMEHYGLVCDDKKRDLNKECECDKHYEIVKRSNDIRSKKYVYKISSEKHFNELPYTDFTEFLHDIPLIYGKFIFKYFIFCLSDNKNYDKALNLYHEMKSGFIKNRNSYFYGFYWDIVLGLRPSNDDLESRFELSDEVFEKKLDEKIINELKNQNITSDIYNKIKLDNTSFKVIDKNIEIDNQLSSKDLIWSKPICITKDAKGNNFKFVKNWGQIDDNIPSYCFYDFDEHNLDECGLLYNYAAVKALSNFPIPGWRLPNQLDIDVLKNYNTKQRCGFFAGWRDKEGLPYVYHGEEFLGVNQVDYFWIKDSPTPNGFEIGAILSDEAGTTILNCKECFFSVKLINSKQ